MAPPIEGRMRFWGFVVLSLGIGVVIARRKLFATPGGTRLTAALLLWAAVPAVFVAICFFTNQTYSAFAAGIAQAAVSAVIAITLLPRVAPAAVVGICGSIVIAVRPDWEVPVMVMLSPVTIGVVVLALRSRNNELRRGQS